MMQQTLKALLSQSVKIDTIRVNIPKAYRRFPSDSFSMPEVPEGVTIAVEEVDMGPSTKVLPTLRDLQGTEETIIYCDDDRLPEPHWAAALLDASQRFPGQCVTLSGWDVDRLNVFPNREPDDQGRAQHAKSEKDWKYRVKRIHDQMKPLIGQKRSGVKPSRTRTFLVEGKVDIMEGAGGVLLKPDALASDVFEVPAEMWTVDDIWLSGMAAKAKTSIQAINGPIPPEIPGSEEDALIFATIDGKNRAEANLQCVRYLQAQHGIWT